MSTITDDDQNGASGGTSASSLVVNPSPEVPESTNLTLVVMMGLPASGKSTVANQLVQSLSKLQVVVVSFDEFVPLNVQAAICHEIENGNSSNDEEDENHVASSNNLNVSKSMSMMKLLRTKFAHCVDTIVKYVQNLTVSPDPLTLEEVNYISTLEALLGQLDSTKWVMDESFLSKTQSILEKLTRVNIEKGDLTPPKIVIIVDDNNYYHSMRNSFYQIAKLSEIGFCLINCKVPLKTCVQRNLERPADSQVPPKTIVEMGLKYEEPNPLQNPCDMYSVEVNTNEEVNLAMLEQIINSSFRNFPKKNEDRTVDIERERRICSENEIHQADLVLRKWISKRFNLSSFSPGLMKSADARKSLSKELSSKKTIVLEKLRLGELTISFTVCQDIEFRNEIIGFFEKVDVSLT